MQSHQLIDERSRALAFAVAEQVRLQPALVDVAKQNIAAWLKTSSPSVWPVLEEWQSVLGGSTAEVIEILLSDSARAVRMRQSNPFAGVLPSGERTEILKRFSEK
jgi:hypothetical protein